MSPCVITRNGRRTALLAALSGVFLPCMMRADEARRTRVARVGWIAAGAGALPTPAYFEALREGLRERGWVEGRNLAFEVRWGEPAKATQLVSEVYATDVDVLVAQGAMVLSAVKPARTTPIVFGFSGDPIEANLIESYARPGRHLTGIAMQSPELVGKRLEMLLELLTPVRHIAILANPAHPGEQIELRHSQAAAQQLGLTVRYLRVTSQEEVQAAFATIAAEKVDALVAFPDALVMSQARNIAEFCATQRIGAVSGWSEFAEAGNLMTYGPSLRATWKQAAGFVDKLLRGARPEDLPVEQPSRYELVINGRTARHLGLAIPASLQVRADRIIT